MASITVRNLDETTKGQLRQRAARHGWSMEQEVRHILQATLASDQPNALGFAQRVQQRFKGLDADDLALPPRQAARPLPDFNAP